MKLKKQFVNVVYQGKNSHAKMEIIFFSFSFFGKLMTRTTV
jgi:hypothetical protein